MSRYARPCFNASELDGLSDEQQNRLLFDWWCDDRDRLAYIAHLKRRPTPFKSRALRQDDPAPPLSQPAPQGFRTAYWISDPAHARQALTNATDFGNLPYAGLGGAVFLLAQDPAGDGFDWHAEQQRFIEAMLTYPSPGLRDLARLAVDQAELVSLARPAFDLAEWAHQSALRFAGQLFGYGAQDHGLLDEASRSTYRALQYLAIGQHFVTEPGTLPAAQQALARLVTRSSQLMDEYAQRARAPRRYGYKEARDWPAGVQPWCELGLASALGEPVLRRACEATRKHCDTTQPRPRQLSELSGRDRASVLAILLAGTLGNIVSAVCLLVQSLLAGPRDERDAIAAIDDAATLEAALERRLARHPPITVLPRRTRVQVTLGGQWIDAGVDCLVLLEGSPGCPHAHEAQPCPRIWGGVESGSPQATHACLGRHLSMPLIATLVQRTLKLPGLKPARDPLTAEPLELERLWGFECRRYPLVFERERVRAQQNLIVAMRIKTPVSENAARLRRMIAASAPRIEHVLNGFGHVHFAWFEFTDDDSQLVLRTLFEGKLESYLLHFALRAGDLFDGLFELLEGSPPRPVAEHPHDFVATISRLNRAPVAGYLYSAHTNRSKPKLGRPGGQP